MDPITQTLLPIGAAITAGVFYNTLGLWKRYRAGKDVSIDWGKVGRNVIIGIGTGIAARVYDILRGVEANAITSFETFVLAAGAAFGTVVLVEAIFSREDKKEDENFE